MGCWAVYITQTCLHDESVLFQLVTDTDQPGIFYEWTEFLARSFRKISPLLTLQPFRCDVNYPGFIFVKAYVNDIEKELKLLKIGMTIEKTALPNITKPWFGCCTTVVSIRGSSGGGGVRV